MSLSFMLSSVVVDESAGCSGEHTWMLAEYVVMDFGMSVLALTRQGAASEYSSAQKCCHS